MTEGKGPVLLPGGMRIGGRLRTAEERVQQQQRGRPRRCWGGRRRRRRRVLMIRVRRSAAPARTSENDSNGARCCTTSRLLLRLLGRPRRRRLGLAAKLMQELRALERELPQARMPTTMAAAAVLVLLPLAQLTQREPRLRCCWRQCGSVRGKADRAAARLKTGRNGLSTWIRPWRGTFGGLPSTVWLCSRTGMRGGQRRGLWPLCLLLPLLPSMTGEGGRRRWSSPAGRSLRAGLRPYPPAPAEKRPPPAARRARERTRWRQVRRC